MSKRMSYLLIAILAAVAIAFAAAPSVSGGLAVAAGTSEPPVVVVPKPKVCKNLAQLRRTFVKRQYAPKYRGRALRILQAQSYNNQVRIVTRIGLKCKS